MMMNREMQGLAAPTSPADPLNATNARKLLGIFRNFILSIGSQELQAFGLSEAISVVLHLARSLQLPISKASKDDKKNLMPSTKGEHTEQPANTVLEFLLGTLLELLRLRENDPDVPIKSIKPDVLNDALQFCFSCLFFVNTHSARAMAGECLGLFSKCHLEPVSLLFTKEFSLCKNEEEFRQYVSYQRAVKYIKFGFDRNRLPHMLNYLGFVSQIEPKYKNSVLRAAFTESLIDLMLEINAAQHIPKIEDDQLRSQCIAHLHKIYEQAKKWYKKPKTRLCSFKLQLFMYLLFDAQKMDLCKKDIVKLLLEQLSDKNYRQEGIESFSSFLRILPTNFAKSTNPSSKVWKAIIAEVIPALFQKKAKDVQAVEWKELTGVLSEMLRLDETLLTDKSLINVLSSPNDYSIEARCVVLRTFGSMVATNPDTPEGQSLQPIATPIITQFVGNEASQNNSGVLSAILLCFPHLCIPEKRKSIASCLVPWALSSDPELWTLSLQALQSFLLLDPDSNLLFLLVEMENNLKSRANTSAEETLVFVRGICTLLTTFFNTRNQLKNVQLSSEQWPNVKAMLEALCLCWVMHGDLGVREETCRLLTLLQNFSKVDVAFKSSKKSLSSLVNQQFLEDSPARSKKSKWLVQVCDTLLKEPESFAVLISTCWKLLKEPLKLENHAVFFIKTLHLVLAGDDSDVGTSIASQIIECLSSAEESLELRTIVCDALEMLDPSCVESFARIAVTEVGKKKKIALPSMTIRSKKSQPLTPAMQELQMLRPYQILCSKITYDLYNQSNSVRQFVRERLSFWTSNQVDLGSLEVANRFFLTEIIRFGFQLEGNLTEQNQAVKVANANETMMNVVMNVAFLGETNAAESTAPVSDPVAFRRSFRVSVVSGVRDYFRFMPIVVEKLSVDFIPFLFRCVSEWGGTVEEPAIDALSYCLNRFPPKVDLFALDGIKGEGALFFLAAAKTFVKTTKKWITKVGSEKLIQFCLLHLCSSSAQARQVSMTLANALSAVDISPGYLLSYMPNLSYNMYVELALEYSRALSSKVVHLSSGVIAEFVSVYSYLTDQQKSLALQLVEPWCRNFSEVASSSREKGTVILDGLLRISIESNKIYHREYVQQLWRSLFHVYKPEHMKLACSFLIAKYPESPDHCIISLASLTRTEYGASIVAVLVKQLQDFADIPQGYPCNDVPYITKERHAQLVLDPQYRDVLDEVLIKEQAEHDVKAASAFHMLSYVSLEKGSLLWPFLPVILQNTLVLYHAKTEYRSHAQSLVSNLVQSILRLVDVKDEKREKAEKILANLDAHLERISSDTFTEEDVTSLVECFEGVSENLREKWCELCLSWGLGSSDSMNAIISVKLYGFLQGGKMTNARFFQLASFCFICSYHGWFVKLERMLSVMHERVLSLACESKEIKSQFVILISTLLLTSSHAQVLICLKMLQYIFNADPSLLKTFPQKFRAVCMSEANYRQVLLRMLLIDSTKEAGIWLIRCMVLNIDKDKISQDFVVELFLMVCGIVAQTAEAQREDVYKFLVQDKVPVFFRDCVELFSRQNFHLKAPSRHQFLIDFTELMLARFPGSSCSLDILLVILRNGLDAWKPACYRLLNVLMDAMPRDLSEQQFKLIAEMATYHCYHNNPDIRSSAERMILSLIVLYQNNVVSAQILSLVRVVPSNTNVVESERIAQIFPGDYGFDFVNSVKQSVLSIHTNVLKNSNSLSVTNSIYERFKETKKLSFPGYTDNNKAQTPSRNVVAVGDPAKPSKAAPQMVVSPRDSALSESGTTSSVPKTMRAKKHHTHGRNKSIGNRDDMKKVEKLSLGGGAAQAGHPNNPHNFQFLNDLLTEVTLLCEPSPDGPK